MVVAMRWFECIVYMGSIERTTYMAQVELYVGRRYHVDCWFVSPERSRGNMQNYRRYLALVRKAGSRKAGMGRSRYSTWTVTRTVHRGSHVDKRFISSYCRIGRGVTALQKVSTETRHGTLWSGLFSLRSERVKCAPFPDRRLEFLLWRLVILPL